MLRKGNRQGARREASPCDEAGASDAQPQFVRRIALLPLGSHDLLELGVPRSPHLTHPAGPDGAEDLVTT